MSATIYSLSPITINSTTLAVDNIALPQDIVSNLHQHSGNEYPTLVTVPGANPKITFRSPFYDAYTLFGLSELNITALNVYFAKFVSLVRGGASAHPKLALAASATACGHITGWSVSQDGILMADCEIAYLSSDGTTHPIAAVATGQSLPALSAQPTLHTLGPISVNGTVYGGLNSSTVSLGQQLQIDRSDGDLYPRVAARTGGQPVLRGDHLDPLALIGVTGYPGANITANVVQYYRAYSATTGLNSAANSVSITIASGRIHPTSTTAAQGQVAKCGLEVYALSTSSTHPYVIATNASAPAVP